MSQLWSDIARATALLQGGFPVAVPSETVYGLAAVINQPAAIRAVFRIKERPFFDPLIVHVANLADVDPLVTQWSASARRLAEVFWPGPLTLVLPRSEKVDPIITSGLPSVAVRCPEHPVFRRLIRNTGVPLAAPSANPFGKTSATRAEHVRAYWPEQEVFVVDGGPCTVGIESTVLAFECDGSKERLLILRPGMLGIEELRQVLPHAEIQFRAGAASPGQLAEHYQPRLPLVLVDERIWRNSADVLTKIQSAMNWSETNYLEISLPDESVLAARELYSSLQQNFPVNVHCLIFVLKERMKKDPGWTGILDRIRRASALVID